jgi:hypothetical protein
MTTSAAPPDEASDDEPELDADELAEEDDEPIVEMTEDSLGGSTSVRDRDAALDGDLPLLMVHRERQRWNLLTPLVNELHRTNANSLSLGVVVNLPRLTDTAAHTWLTGNSRASLRIADPEVYSRDDLWGGMLLLERDGRPRQQAPGQPAPPPPRPLMPQQALQWAYWTQPLPTGPTASWVEQVLEAQRLAGANLLLTPGVPLEPQAAVASLAELEQQVTWARGALGGGERLAVNLTIDALWLSDTRLRTQLLNHIIETDDDVWYVRVKWPLMAATYGQLVDAAVLDGYQELASFMEDEQRVLLLPTSGGTGWVSLAWGATGFGTGIGSGARGFTTGRPIRMRQPPPRTPRYFERALLHTIDKTTADSLARIPGHVPCPCRYCAQLRNSPTWDYGLSGAHYLLTVGELTAALAGGSGKRAVARRLVRAADRYRSQVSTVVPLTGNESAAHLTAWLARLR